MGASTAPSTSAYGSMARRALTQYMLSCDDGKSIMYAQPTSEGVLALQGFVMQACVSASAEQTFAERLGKRHYVESSVNERILVRRIGLTEACR